MSHISIVEITPAGSATVPAGLIIGESTNAAKGVIRWNDSTKKYEYYNETTWVEFGGGSLSETELQLLAAMVGVISASADPRTEVSADATSVGALYTPAEISAQSAYIYTGETI